MFRGFCDRRKKYTELFDMHAAAHRITENMPLFLVFTLVWGSGLIGAQIASPP